MGIAEVLLAKSVALRNMQNQSAEMHYEMADSLAKYSNVLSGELEAAKNSIPGKLGLDPTNDPFLHTTVNTAANLAQGIGRNAGDLLEAGYDTLRNGFKTEIPQNVRDAYARELKGSSLPEDAALLDGRTMPSLVGGIAALPNALLKASKTNRQSIQDWFNTQSAIDSIDKASDVSSWVDPRPRGQADRQLQMTTVDAQNEFAAAKEAMSKGDFIKSLGLGASSAGTLVKSVVDYGLDNPTAALGAVAQNAPQLIIGALGGPVGTALVTGAYGVDVKNKALQDHIDKTGEMPSEEAMLKINALSAAAGGMEFVGDRLTLGANKLLGSAGKSIAAAQDGMEKSLLKSALGFGGGIVNNGITRAGTAGLLAGGGEYGTEFTQTILENAAKNEDTSFAEAHLGGTIGAWSGGVVGALVGGEPGAPSGVAPYQTKKVRDAAFEAAVVANDSSKYADPTSQDYNPSTAIAVHLDNSKLDSTPIENRLASFDQAIKILDTADEARYKNQKILDIARGSKEELATAETSLAAFKEGLANADPANTDLIAQFTDMVDVHEKAIAISKDKTAIKLQALEVDKQNKLVNEAGALAGQFKELLAGTDTASGVANHIATANTAVDPTDTAAVENVQKSVGVLISRSMASSSSITGEEAAQLASNTSNSLTAPQREYFRVFSEARLAHNALQDMDSVHKEVLFGSPAKNGQLRQMGLVDYNKEIELAFASNNKKVADTKLELLTKFATGMSSKAMVSAAALEYGTKRNHPVWIANTGNGNWRQVGVLENMTPEEKKAAFQVVPGSEKSELAVKAYIPAEADAINKLLAEKKAAYALKFNTASKAVPAAVTPAPLAPVVTPAAITPVTPSVVPAAQTTAAPTSVAPVTPTTQVDETQAASAGVAEAVAATGEATQTKPKPVNVWHGSKEGAGLSNLAERPFTYEGKQYHSVEHAYQTNKSGSFDEATYKRYSNVKESTGTVEGRKIAGTKQANPSSNMALMKALIKASFEGNKEATAQLLATGTADITHTQDKSVWNKAFPQILMEVREELKPTTTQGSSNEKAPEAEQTESEQPAEATEEVAKDAGKLSAFSQFKADWFTPVDGVTPLWKDVFLKMNLVAQFFTQNPGKENTTTRPLVAVKDFISTLKGSSHKVSDFLDLTKEEGVMSVEAKRAFNHFYDTMIGKNGRSWLGILQTNFHKFDWAIDSEGNTKTNPVKDLEFKSQDMMQYLYDGTTGNASVDENLATAIAAAVYGWVLDKAGDTFLKKKKDILRMHGKKEGDFLSREGVAALQGFDAFYDTAAASLGKAAVQALGLKAKKDAPKDLMPKLESAMGNHALNLLFTLGYATQTERTKQVVDAFFVRPKEAEATSIFEDEEVLTDEQRAANEAAALVNYTYISFNPAFRENAKAFKEANQNSGSVIEKLFGMDSLHVEANDAPSKFRQATAKDTESDIPKVQAKAINAVQQAPHVPIETMWKAVHVLGMDTIESIAGVEEVLGLDDKKGSSTSHHKEEVRSILAQNDNLINQLSSAFNMVGEIGSESFKKARYVTGNVWKNFRAGYMDRSMNLQSSKIHRALFSRPEWNVDIPLDKESKATLDEYMVSIAMMLGNKTDQVVNTKTLGKVFTYDPATNAYTFNDENMTAAVEVLQKHVVGVSDEMVTAEEKAAIKAVATEGVLSLQALVSFAQYSTAKAEGKTTFNTTLLVGADGKTNGPMLTLLALGVANTTDLERGGFYPRSQGEDIHYSKWYSNPGSMDLYQHTGKMVLDAATFKLGGPIEVGGFTQQDFDALQVLTGTLRDGSKVTGAMRNLMKGFTSPFFFGSSVSKAIRGMQDSFIASHYSNLSDHAQGKRDESLRTYIDSVNALMQLGMKDRALGGQAIPNETDISVMLNTSLNSAQERALREAFNTIIGSAVKETMELEFYGFIQRRNDMLKVIQSSYEVFAVAYREAKEDYKEKLRNEGKLAYRIVKKGKDKDMKIDLHDLTEEQESYVRTKIMDLLPVMHSAYSKNEMSNLRAGLAMYKQTKDVSLQPQYTAQTYFDNSGKAKSQAFNYVTTGPGAYGLSAAIHSTDSFLMHMAMLSVQGTLNVHDEAANGVGKIGGPDGIATAINKNTAEVFLNYSPVKESMQMLKRSARGLANLIDHGLISKGAVADILLSWSIAYNRGQPDEDLHESPYTVANALVVLAVNNAVAADTNTLTHIANMGVVDQYTWEGGQYQVSPALNKQAEVKLAAMDKTIPAKFAEDMKRITEFGKTGKVSASVVTEADPELTDTLQAPKAISSTDELGLPGVSGTQVALTLPLLAKAVASGVSVIDALNALSPQDKAQATQELYNAAKGLPEGAATPFGLVGRSKDDTDPAMLKMFLDNGGKMTAKAVIAALRGSTKNAFYKRMLTLLERAVPAGTNLTLLTPASAADAAIKTEHSSRGWHVTDGGKTNEIYVLSPEFVNSGLTEELLIHELLHAALNQTIDKALAGKSANGGAAKLVENLNALREAAQKHVGTSKKFANALGDIHEFVSWGMTNEAFQKEVLMQIKVPNRIARNKLVTAMQEFIQSITSLFFGQHENAKDVGGMSLFLSGVTGLFHDAGQFTPDTVSTLTSRAMASSGTNTYTTQDIYAALGKTVSDAFDKHLNGILKSIVERLHGPSGSFKDAVMVDSPRDAFSIFTDALYTGKAPFASDLFVSGHKISDQEAFVIDQVEATVRAGLDAGGGKNWVVFNELERLFKDMRSQLSLKDFHDGDWSTAQPYEKETAEKLYNSIFKDIRTDANGRSDYLSKFAAMGMAHEGFNKALEVTTTKLPKVLADNSITGVLTRIFHKILGALNGKVTNTAEGQQANHKLQSLLNTLVSIEIRKAEALKNGNHSWLDTFDGFKRGSRRGLKNTAKNIANLGPIKSSKNKALQAAGHAINIITTPGRLKIVFASVGKIRDTHFSGMHGVAAGLINDLAGPKDVLENMLRAGKYSNQLRQQVIDNTNVGILAGFDKEGKYLTVADKSAITDTLLRTDAQTLLQHFSLTELGELLNDKAKLDAQITAFQNQLSGFTAVHREYLSSQANALGYYLVTGHATVPSLNRSASNIAHMYDSLMKDQLTDSEQAIATKTVDVLSSLYALKYSSATKKALVSKVLEKETARGNNTNGIQLVLSAHKLLIEQSNERLFTDSQALAHKGYVSEVYNPNTDVRTAGDQEGVYLESLGYKKFTTTSTDPTDLYGLPKDVYVLRDGGKLPRVTGMLSLTGEHSKGSKLHGAQAIGTHKKIAAAKAIATQRAAHTNTVFDPTKITENYTLPILNASGDSVNYAYMMRSSTKDSLLERDSRFDTVLGVMAGSIFDKVASPVHNRKVVELLFAEHAGSSAKDASSFIDVSADSADPEVREIYNLLPKSTKQNIREVWGRPGMLVRADAMAITFGNRKHSMSYMFEKNEDDRNSTEKLIVHFITKTLRHYAKQKLNMTDAEADVYAGRGAVTVRRAENWWQALVKETKDIIVVRTGFTALNNIMSNKVLLWLYKVPAKDIAFNTKLGWEAAEKYTADNKELFQLQANMDRGYIIGDIQEMTLRIAELKNLLANNPAKPLIEAGLLPTIAEDLGEADSESPYSHKARFVRYTDKYTSKLNPHVRNVAKHLYMAPGTTLHQTFSRITMLSDFSSRFVLYNELTTRKENPLSQEKALYEVSRAFINYDIPMQKMVQYLDDMGLMMFTKYFIRIQAVVRDRFINAPGRMALVIALQGYFHWLPSVMDASIITRFGSNPFTIGPLSYFSVLDEIAPVNALLSSAKGLQ